MPITERPHSEPAESSSYSLTKYYAGGEIRQTISPETNIYEAVTQSLSREDIVTSETNPYDYHLKALRTTVVLINKNPDGDEAWILPQDEPGQANWADRIRIRDDNSIEFTYCNGTETPLQACFSIEDGSLNYASLQLENGVETTVPPRISPAAISDIKNTFIALKHPDRSEFGISAINNFADSFQTLQIFVTSQQQ